MPEPRPPQDIVHGVPPVAVSSTSTRVNKTGSWKYIRPVYEDKVAPCNQGCPVGIDIEGYMDLLRQDKVQEALDLLLRENPLPATTGRVCYHPCEGSCNRQHLDEPVAIHAVERTLGDLALERPQPAPADRTRRESVGIVGAGPAGLTCAYHLARMGYGVTVYEADAEPGGVLRWGIPEYRLPKRVLAAEVGRIAALGVEFRCGVKVGREITFGELDRHAAVFVATGVHKSRPLGIPGEGLQGVRPGLAFLREVNAGERPRLGRHVVVIGGGNTAMDCARTALRLGAEVLVLYRRGRAEMPANPEEVEEAAAEGVRFEFLAAPIRALGDSRVPDEEPLAAIEDSFGGFEGLEARPYVVGLECVRMALGEPDASGRRRPVPVAGSEFRLEADTVLTALGEEADLDFLPGEVCDESGVIRVSLLGESSRTAVFAGGDVTEAPHTVSFAMGSGKRAAIGIDHYLGMLRGDRADSVELGELRLGPDGNLSPVKRENPANQVVGYDQINPAHFAKVARNADRLRPAAESRQGFEEANLGLRRDVALAEAHRCFNCGVCNSCEVCLVFCPDVAITRRADGRFDINYDYCKGCGVCATECPRGAMSMTREGL